MKHFLSYCPKCSSIFMCLSTQGYKKYCSRKCANSRKYTLSRSKKLFDTISKKEKFKNQFGIHSRKIKPEIAGPYTRIYLCTCKYSGKKWYSATVKQIHPELSRTKKEYAYSCRFQFGISSYPEWFNNASELIKNYGWYSTPGSKKGIKNINGISRDHLYSISDGWLNKIAPEIIRHPANCALIPHTENQSKYKNSKITIDELYSRIEKFNKIYGEE